MKQKIQEYKTWSKQTYSHILMFPAPFSSSILNKSCRNEICTTIDNIFINILQYILFVSQNDTKTKSNNTATNIINIIRNEWVNFFSISNSVKSFKNNLVYLQVQFKYLCLLKNVTNASLSCIATKYMLKFCCKTLFFSYNFMWKYLTEYLKFILFYKFLMLFFSNVFSVLKKHDCKWNEKKKKKTFDNIHYWSTYQCLELWKQPDND